MIGAYLAIGGAAGAICRYLLGKLVSRLQAQASFPLAMLAVNILGSFGLGLSFGVTYGGIPEPSQQDAFYFLAGVGFFGAFTTFSTFSMEAFQLLQRQKYKALIYYVSLSVVGSIVFFLLGIGPSIF